MGNIKRIIDIYPESFRANLYTTEPFRMIGLIDVVIEYDYGIERVTLPYYRSSGTNSGKTEGLWYPIAGIKLYEGRFTEFTDYLNIVLMHSTRRGRAIKGWLAKSLFFSRRNADKVSIRGFSNGAYHDSLFNIGNKLKEMFEANKFKEVYWLEPETLNYSVTSDEIYDGNICSQKDNFESFIEDIFCGE